MILDDHPASAGLLLHHAVGHDRGIEYSARLVVPELGYSRFIEVVALHASQRRLSYDIILGTSFLKDFFFEYDGPNACLLFHLGDEEPDDGYAS